MSEERHRYRWSDVLSAHYDQRDFKPIVITVDINEKGEMIDGHLESNGVDQRTERAQSDSLSEHIHPSYRDALNTWLASQVGDQDRQAKRFSQSVICPFKLTHTELTWFELRVDQGRTLLLIELTETLNRMRLSARASNLLGFHHDLANRLFFFKALPDLIEFSEPQDLLGEVTEELPRLLTFLDARLSMDCIGAVEINRVRDDRALIESIHHLFTRLSEIEEIAALFTFSQEEMRPNATHHLHGASMGRVHSLLSLEWSLKFLAQLIKRGALKRDSSSPIKLTLSPTERTKIRTESSAERLHGVCGALLPDDIQLCLRLDLRALEDVSLAQGFERWHQRAHVARHRSDLSVQDPDALVSLSAWIESWVSASFGLMGAVYIVENSSVEIRF